MARVQIALAMQTEEVQALPARWSFTGDLALSSSAPHWLRI